MASVVLGVAGALLSYSSARQNQAAAQAAAADQYEIADRIQQREEFLFDTYKDEYRRCELDLKDEVCNMEIYVAKPELAARKAQVAVRREFLGAACKIKDCLQMECVGASCATERDLAFAEANAAVSAMNAAVATEEQQKIVRDQMRRDEQYRMVSLAHGAYFSTSGSVLASQIYGQYAQAARSAASRSGAAVGQFLARAGRGFGNGGGSVGGGAGDTYIDVNSYNNTNPTTGNYFDTTPQGSFDAGLLGLGDYSAGGAGGGGGGFVNSNTGVANSGDFGQL